MRFSALSEGKRWLESARDDLDDAQALSEHGRYNTASFLAQQAGEKALKAFLLACGAERVWGHSLRELCQDAAELDDRFSELLRTAASLDKYYIPTRYPDALPGGTPRDAFEHADAANAIEKARKVIEKVEEYWPA